MPLKILSEEAPKINPPAPFFGVAGVGGVLVFPPEPTPEPFPVPAPASGVPLGAGGADVKDGTIPPASQTSFPAEIAT